MDNSTSRNNPRRQTGGGGGRDDCWSESGTEALIEAWGDRYLQLNRGILRQKDWKEVADAVNGNRDGFKAPRTDIQCKNRVDTLKKKYKLEKAKPSRSQWPFFNRIEYLIGINNTTPLKKRTPPSAASRSKSKPIPNPNPNSNIKSMAVIYSAESSMPNSSGSNESSLGGGGGGGKGGHRVEDVGFKEETVHKELARAILKFGEIYEKIESSKQQQVMELEKQRMEFTKSLEFERLNMFLESQFKLEKMKMSSKRSSTAGKKS